MKIGISPAGFSRWGEERYQKLKSLGFDCVDFDMISTNSEFYTASEDAFEARMQHEKALADAAGIIFSQVHGPWRCPPADGTEEERAERKEKMVRSMRGAALLGCKNWVIHPLMPHGEYDIGSGNEADTRRINVDFFRDLVKHAREHGVTICLENMPFRGFCLSKPAEILSIVCEINDAHFKACLDTGHAAMYEGVTPASALRELGDAVRAIHAHDNDGSYDYHGAPCTGVIDWADFVRALREIGFTGAFSMETHPDKSLPDAEFEKFYADLVKTASALLA